MATTLGQFRQYLRYKNRNSVSERSEFIINRIIRDSLFQLAQNGEWDFFLRTLQVLFFPTYSTGTVSATFNNTAVTGAGTAWATPLVRAKESYIRINGNQNVNLINSIGGVTALTLADIFSGETGTDLTYLITHDRVALADNFRTLYSLNSPQLPSPLTPTSIQDIQYRRFFQQENGFPRVYTIETEENTDLSSQSYLTIYPPSNQNIQLQMNYAIWPLRVTEATADSTLLSLPEAAEYVFLQYCLAQLDDDQKGLPSGARLQYLNQLTSQYLSAHRLKKQMPTKSYASVDIAGYINPLMSSMAPGQPEYT